MSKADDLIQQMLVLVDEIEEGKAKGKDVKKKYNELDQKNSELFGLLDSKSRITAPGPSKKVMEPKFEVSSRLKLSEGQLKAMVKELKIKYSELDRFVKSRRGKKKVVVKAPDYTIYEPSEYGRTANKYMKGPADRLVKKFPKFFKPMFKQFNAVNMEVLSRTYVSMMLFYGLLSLPILAILFVVLNLVFQLNWGLIVFLVLLCTALTFVGFYFYPSSLRGGRSKKMKLELPFALVHMSAVAGSGAKPIAIFELLAESGEFVELKTEIKKILNYVNLFGYNLSTAMKAVSRSTPSKEFKELLEGLVSTIETGGNLSGYLNEKAQDALSTYKLDRKKQVDALATYSDVYTAILIAAPLLLIVTLAIINSIGGQLGGMEVGFIAWIGVLGVMPLLNVGFLVFLKITQPNL